MKQILFSLTLGLFIITIFSCKKNKGTSCYSLTAKGRIIGYDPCAYFKPDKTYGAGFVIELEKTATKDTVVSYQIPEGLFNFQTSYIDGSYSSFLFRPTVQDLFKINFSYREAAANEKTIIICNGTVNTADYNAAVKGREIFISCISKQ